MSNDVTVAGGAAFLACNILKVGVDEPAAGCESVGRRFGDELDVPAAACEPVGRAGGDELDPATLLSNLDDDDDLGGEFELPLRS